MYWSLQHQSSEESKSFKPSEDAASQKSSSDDGEDSSSITTDSASNLTVDEDVSSITADSASNLTVDEDVSSITVDSASNLTADEEVSSIAAVSNLSVDEEVSSIAADSISKLAISDAAQQAEKGDGHDIANAEDSDVAHQEENGTCIVTSGSSSDGAQQVQVENGDINAAAAASDAVQETGGNENATVAE